MSPNSHFLHPNAAQHYIARRVPSFHQPFNDREPSHTIPLQTLPPLTTNYGYTSHERYNHSHHHAQVSPPDSARTPSTSIFQITTYREPLTKPAIRNDSKPKTPRSRWVVWVRNITIRWFVEWWMLEILSWGFSAMCMMAIIGIVIIYDGHPIPNWPLGLTINGLISVFSNFAKAALLLSTTEALGQLKWNWFGKDSQSLMDFGRIDMASRGPWGALLLILRHKGTTLTSIGALIIVLALPLDLFFQQIVTLTPGFVISSNLNGTVPRSLVYEPLDGIHTINGSQRITFSQDMVAYSDQFFTGNGTVPQLYSMCPTINCTWEPFDTLAVCSKCTDMSKDLRWDCGVTPAVWLGNLTMWDDLYPNVTACGYWFDRDNASMLMSGYVVGDDDVPGEALVTRISGLTDPDPSSRAPVFGGSINFKDVHYPIMDFLVSGTLDGSDGAYANNTAALHECVLYWCVKSVETSFEWGYYSENTTKTVQLGTNMTAETPWFGFIDETGLPHNRYLANFNLSLPDSGRPGGDIAFGVTNSTMVKTVLMLDQIGPAYVTATSLSDDSNLSWLMGGQFFSNLPEQISMSTKANPWLPPHNTSEHVAKLASTMTTVMRNMRNEDGDRELVMGKAWNQVTLVQTRWQWITLPLVLLGIGLAFLMLTVVKSSREENEVGIWRTSVIAVLFNGLGDEVQQSVGPNFRMGEANAKARQLKVKLQPD